VFVLRQYVYIIPLSVDKYRQIYVKNY